jgi:transcriptional regulator with XRE-family HTH domain
MSIPQSEKDDIRRLRAKGFSVRKIARMTGRSRNTIAKILRTRPDDDDARIRRKKALKQLAEAPPEKCPGCGRMVTFPCALCRARIVEEKNRRSGLRPRDDPIDRRPPPGIELRGPDRARYQEVHDRKRRRGDIPWER